jgi:hypothetical protein
MTRTALALALALAAASLASAAAAAQQPAPRPAPPPRPTMQALLNGGYDLKSVLPGSGPCGNRPDNRAQACPRELYFLQSPAKTNVYRCELGLWNGVRMMDCTPVG